MKQGIVYMIKFGILSRKKLWVLLLFQQPSLMKLKRLGLKLSRCRRCQNPFFLELDAGERDVIALALSEQTTRIVLDEKRARKVAQSLKLNVIGTLGILMLAKQNQIIPNVKPLLDAMMTEAQYWVNESLYDNVLQAVSEDEIE